MDRKEQLLHEIVDECDTNGEIINCGVALIHAVLKTVSLEGKEGRQAAEMAKIHIISDIQEM